MASPTTGQALARCHAGQLRRYVLPLALVLLCPDGRIVIVARFGRLQLGHSSGRNRSRQLRLSVETGIISAKPRATHCHSNDSPTMFIMSHIGERLSQPYLAESVATISTTLSATFGLSESFGAIGAKKRLKLVTEPGPSICPLPRIVLIALTKFRIPPVQL